MFSALTNMTLKGKKSKESATLQFTQAIDSERPSLSTILDDISSAIPLSENVDETAKDVAVGRALALAAVVQSTHMDTTEEECIKSMAKDLFRLRLREDEAASISVHTLIHLISVIPSEMFSSCVWARLERVLSVGWENCTPDRLLILLTCLRYHTDTIPENYLQSKWGHRDVLSSASYSNIIKLLQCISPKDTHCMTAITRHLFTSGLRIPQFWTAVTTTLFMTKNTTHHSVAIALIDSGINTFQSPKQLISMLTPKFFAYVTKRLKVPKKQHNDPQLLPIKLLLENLVNRVKSSGDDKLQTLVVNHFIENNEYVGFDEATKTRTFHSMVYGMLVMNHYIRIENNEYVGFDEATKTRTFHSMVYGLTSEAGKRYAETLKDILHNSSKSKNLRLWAIAQLTSLITIPTLGTDSDFQLSALLYIAQHSLFVANECSSSIDKQLRGVLLTQLYKALNNLSTYKPAGMHRDPVTYINNVYKVVAYVQKLMTNKEWSLADDVDPDTVQEWGAMYRRVHTIRKKSQSSKLNESHAFQLLFLHLGLQLFIEPQQAINALKDVYHCYDKAFKKRPAPPPGSDTDDEPDWIDVVTEVLISLLCQPSHLARKIAQNVYSLLHEHVTLSSIDIIINVLIPEDEDSDLMFMNDNEEESDSDMNADDDADEAADVDHKNSDDDSGVEEDRGSVDDAFRKTLEAALGPAALVKDDGGEEKMEEEENDEEEKEEEEDNEEDEEQQDEEQQDEDDEDDVIADNLSDMSDDTMLRLDTTLAEVFRSQFKNKKDKRQKKEQVMNLKLRALDLLEGLTHASTLANGRVLVSLLKPLLVMMDLGNSDTEAYTLSNRAAFVYNCIIKNKKHIVESKLDNDELFVLMSELIDFCKSSLVTDAITCVCHATTTAPPQSHDCLILICWLDVSYPLLGNSDDLQTATPNRDNLLDAAVKGYLLLINCALKQGNPKSNPDDTTTTLAKNATENHEKIFAHLSSLLKDCLHKTESHLRETFFKKLVKLNNVVMWPLSDVLVECVADDSLKVFKKTQAALMLTLLVHRHVVIDIGEDKWRSFLEKFMDALHNVVVPMKYNDIKPKLLYNLLDIVARCVVADQSSAKCISPEVVAKVQKLAREYMNKDCCKLWNRIQKHGHLSQESRSLAPVSEQKQEPGSGKKRKKIKQENSLSEENSPAHITQGGSKKKNKRRKSNSESY